MGLKTSVSLLVLMFIARDAEAQYFGNYYCQPGRDVFVHLFEWKWTDIQSECTWLAQNNFCAIQVSPPMEHRIVYDPPYPWYQRYQPVSYNINSRSGSENQFKQMVTACNNLGVYIYVDAVINHMTTGSYYGVGSDGSCYNTDTATYPGVPYSSGDFNGPSECSTTDLNIQSYQDANQVRNCRLDGLRDLKHSSTWVRDQIAAYLNKLIGWGVAGFRIDAAKHMWPGDIQAILGRLNNLNITWFPGNTRPYIFQEVIDFGGEAVNYHDYTSFGRVTEFRYGRNLGDVFRKNGGQQLKYLANYGQSWNFLSALDAVVFTDNHDTQRDDSSVVAFFDSNLHKMANAFALAWQYGHVKLTSSYSWQRNIVNGVDLNRWIGPPSDCGGQTNNVVCFNGQWVCEHRWRQLFNMVKLHNVALGQPVVNWWDNGGNAIAFGRSGRAFIIINNENYAINQQHLQTGLPAGSYCDVITCDNNRHPCGNAGGQCRPMVTVDSSGYADFYVPNGEDPMIAIYN